MEKLRIVVLTGLDQEVKNKIKDICEYKIKERKEYFRSVFNEIFKNTDNWSIKNKNAILKILENIKEIEVDNTLNFNEKDYERLTFFVRKYVNDTNIMFQNFTLNDVKNILNSKNVSLINKKFSVIMRIKDYI